VKLGSNPNLYNDYAEELRMGFKLDRRTFLMATGSGFMATSFPEPPAAFAQQPAGGTGRMNAVLGTVKACVFDTFGTVVDWRSSVIAEATRRGKAKGLNINWVEFADRWRMGYSPAMDRVRKGELPWTSLDDLQRIVLEGLLKDYRIEGLSEVLAHHVICARQRHVQRLGQRICTEAYGLHELLPENLARMSKLDLSRRHNPTPT
jgi:hypothetical protein